MKVVLAVEGSTGDIQPTLALCAVLTGAGHEVKLCTSCSRFSTSEEGPGSVAVEAGPEPDVPAGCEFVRTPIWRREEVLGLMVAVGEQEELFRGVGEWFGSIFEDACETIITVIKQTGCDVFLSNNGCLTYVVHEICDVPAGKVVFQPQMTTGVFPVITHPSWGDLSSPPESRRLNLQTCGTKTQQEYHKSYAPFVRAFSLAARPYMERVRARLVSPPPLPLPDDAAIVDWMEGSTSTSSATPFYINAFSPCFLPPGFAYELPAPVLGYWSRPDVPEVDPAALPEGLVSVLGRCDVAPVYIGFGSMSFTGALHWTTVVLGALRAFDPCAMHLVSAGWAGLDLEVLTDPPENAAAGSAPDLKDLKEWAQAHTFFIRGLVPHAWLFPRCRLAVHHGGCGTTHTAALAGIPQVIVPMPGGDQPFWGQAVEDRGAGARTRKLLIDPDLTSEDLLEAMRRVDCAEVQEAAKKLQGDMLQHGNGCLNCMRFLESIVQEHLEKKTAPVVTL